MQPKVLCTSYQGKSLMMMFYLLFPYNNRCFSFLMKYLMMKYLIQFLNGLVNKIEIMHIDITLLLMYFSLNDDGIAILGPKIKAKPKISFYHKIYKLDTYPFIVHMLYDQSSMLSFFVLKICCVFQKNVLLLMRLSFRVDILYMYLFSCSSWPIP